MTVSFASSSPTQHVLCTYFSGLRAELRDRYPNGHSVCTTVVHPSWHNTGILGGEANIRRLNEYGIYPEPASNVSDLVLQNVLNARSGQIFVPRSQNSRAGMRHWPLWAQDAMYGLIRMRMKTQNKKGAPFEFGKDGEMKL